MIEILELKRNKIVDFAKARNELLQKSKADWVLFLDSDEKLLKPLKNVSNKYDGYYLMRKNYFLGQYVGEDKILRLGKRKFLTWKRGVHETWDIKNVGNLDNTIIHNTAENLHDYIKKIDYYSTLHARENLKEKKVSNIFKIVVFPVGKLVVTYIKSKNVVFSIMQSLHSFLSWIKLYFLQH